MSKIKPEYLFFIPLLSVFTLVFIDMDNHKLLPSIILGVTSIYWAMERKIEFNKNNSIWIISTIIIIFLAIKQIHGFSSSSIRIAAGTLLLLLFFPKKIVNEKTLSILILTGSAVAVLYTSYQHHILKVDRSWTVNPIIHSTFTVSLLCVAYYFSQVKNKTLSKVNIVSCLMLVYSINLSETRSALLSFIVCGAFISYHLIKNQKCSKRKAVTFFLGLSVIIILNGTFISRLTNTFSISSNQSTENAGRVSNAYEVKFANSPNYRLHLWSASVDVILKTFPLGSGDSAREILGEKLTSKALSTYSFHHFHNQLINSLTIDGALGLIYALTLFISPVIFWIKNKNESSFIFLIVAIVYFVAGLTDIPLENKPTFCFYLTMFVIYRYYAPNTDNIRKV